KVVKKIGLRTGKWAAVLLLLSVLFVQQTVLAAPPVYGNQATAVSATDVTTLTINRPANTAANDLLLAAIATDGSRTIAAPTGWTIINRGNSGGEVSLAVFYKIATGTEPGNYAFTWTGGEQATGTIMRYTGVNPSSPINTSGFGTGTSNAPTAPTVTTTTAETMVVRIFATDDDDNPFAFPTGYSGRVMLESSATDFSVSLGLADVQQVAAGATGTAAFGMGATEEWRAVTVALNRLSTAPIANQVKGVVFRDYNADGVNDIAEPGVAGITITAYGASGAAVDADTTDANGNYTLTGLTDSVAYRLEMTGLPDYLQPGSVGIDSNTSVVFVTSPATNVQFGVFNPADYCQNNPNMTTPCYYNGNPTGTGTTSTSSFLYSFPYNAANTTPSPTTLAQGGEIGATYGLAYQRSTGQLFAAAMMKRHVGYGPAGSGGIYIIDDPTGTPSSSLFVNLATLGLGYSFGSTSHTNLPNDAVTPNHDGSITNNNDVFDAVGKESFGDMDISEDETTLYLVDLTNRALLSIFIDMPAQVPDASDVTSYSIPDPGCTNGGYRPWALKVQDGLVYVGVVCDQFSATASNPDAFVYTFNPATTGFTQIFSMDLQYTRGYVSSGAPTPSANWRPWISQWSSIWHLGTGLPYGKQVSHPQAILADIEFDNDGSMILGFMDRFGHQSGAANYSTNLASTTRYEGVAAGDLIKACLVNGSYIVESNGSCGGVITTGVGNNQGPGGGEFYWQDMHAVSTNPTAGTHTETTIGSLAMLRGEDEVAVTVWDPINNVMAGGIGWYNNTAGTHPRGYEIYRSITTPDNSDSRLFGKANGLGDLEVLCDPAPVEIGNRIWDDTDRDGIQDPTESGLSGIVVQLYADTTND
ncbi:MAG: hypothetical protein IAF02_24405, partial [Anaerolineae bacterium]|nr:hypothetical protein [Anaerolineae bacterium]